ncbi:aminoglycoside phosphotransferase family protein [Pseudophaeobacter sp.]|uniref:aminoglycoside phosphotransferase family protein n=1 Tax=Pseudophaeobacter sp. TaxID=1971739 RepID=UPI003299194C
MTRFQVTRVLSLVEVPRARIWQVETQRYGTAALKLYTSGNMGNEAMGFPFLAAINGPAARIYQITPDAVLMEWLDGPSLGDIARSGEEASADRTLAVVALEVHHQTRELEIPGLLPLAHWFQALRSPTSDLALSPQQRNLMCMAQNLAEELLASQLDICPLHGDLHHENIRLGPRGFCAFDAKGIFGERCYELANAFRHPKGPAGPQPDAEKIRQRAQLWGQVFEVPPKRLLQWASAKCALSLVWRAGPNLSQDPELQLLEHLLTQQAEL